MRVARLHGREDLRLHDEDKPRPGPGEVLVRVCAVGVCGSDIHWFAEGGIGEAQEVLPHQALIHPTKLRRHLPQTLRAQDLFVQHITFPFVDLLEG